MWQKLPTLESATRYCGFAAAVRYVELIGCTTNAELSWRLLHDSDKSIHKSKNLDGQLATNLCEFNRAEAQGYGIFAVVNGGGHRDLEINEVRAAFIDSDNVDLTSVKFHAPPSFIILRDHMHWHAYWLLGSGVSPDDFRQLQRRLAKHYGTDSTVINPSRIMRVPGFMHQKNPANTVQVLLFDLTGGDEGDGGRLSHSISIEALVLGLPDFASEVPQNTTAHHEAAITLETLRELFSYIDPTFDANQNQWVGLAKAAYYGQLPVIGGYDGPEFVFEWCSGLLWKQRTNDPAFEVPTFRGRAELVSRLNDGPRTQGRTIGLGTAIRLARIGGYSGKLIDQIQDDCARQKISDSPGVNATDKSSLFPSYLISELDSIPEPTWLIRDILPDDSLGIVYGATGSLKTFLMLDRALCAAAGIDWASTDIANMSGYKISGTFHVVIVVGEGARGIKRRIRAWQHHRGIGDELKVLIVPVMPRFSNTDDVSKLIATIRARLGGTDWVIVDTAMRAASGLNLNLPSESQTLIDACERVKNELKCSVTLVHHTGKDEGRGPLGAENLKAAVDLVERVKLVERSAGHRVIQITSEKSKDGEDHEDIHMQARIVSLGVDDEGRPITSLVLSRTAQPSSQATKDVRQSELLSLALAVLRDNVGGPDLSMNGVAEKMAARVCPDGTSTADLQKKQDTMRQFLKQSATSSLSRYASKQGSSRTARWYFSMPPALLAAE